MRVSVKVDFNTRKILESRGLGASNKARKYLASEIVRLSDPYVPFQQGGLKNQRQIASDGSEIVYTQPYAHYQWYGEVMAGRPPKSYTGRKINYSGAPTRGERWTERMMIDKGHEGEKNVENYIKKG
jgi:hypothetical protein